MQPRASNPHAWRLADLAEVPRTGLKVVSTFSCGGGSSMGYRRAGFDVVLANDIDGRMAKHYQENLRPPHYVLAPINQLMARWPAELARDIDLLDGSPPCSTFSMSGKREEDWGRSRKFTEGQANQVLSDLFFDFLDVAEALRPRAIVAENVVGLVTGRAKGYVRMIFERLRAIGYVPQLFQLNAARCGVPQMRQRVFFCAMRADLGRPSLTLDARLPIVTAGEATSDLVLTDEERAETSAANDTVSKEWWHRTHPGETFCSAMKRGGGGTKLAYWNWRRLSASQPAPTLVSESRRALFHWTEHRVLSYREWLRLGSFPDDYRAESASVGRYMIGMSVPPKMTEVVACAVRDQWLL